MSGAQDAGAGLRDELAAWLHVNRDHDEHYAWSTEPCRYCVDWATTLVTESPLAPSAADAPREVTP